MPTTLERHHSEETPPPVTQVSGSLGRPPMSPPRPPVRTLNAVGPEDDDATRRKISDLGLLGPLYGE